MEIRQLRYFLAVVDQGGVSRAAASLHMSQPALSQAIAALEAQTGVPLFHRVGRGVVLSASGEALVGRARAAVRSVERAEETFRDQRDAVRGRLDLVSMPTPGLSPLTRIVTEFARLHPDVTLNVEPAFTTDEAVQSVLSGRTEIALVGTAEPMRTPPARWTPLEVQPFMLIAAPGRLPGPGPEIGIQDVSGLRLITSQPGSLMRSYADRILAAGLDGRIAVEVGHRTSILPLVMAGVGQALLPEGWRQIASLWGADIRTVSPRFELHVAAVTRADDLTPAARAFLTIASRAATDGEPRVNAPS